MPQKPERLHDAAALGEPDSACHPVVAVPARDEEERLPGLIKALGRQTWLAAPQRVLDVVILLNNTSDRSRQAIDEMASRTPLRLHLVEVMLPDALAHVGTARRMSLELARSLCTDPVRSVLLTTDADAVPSPNWIGANLAAIHAGADLVGGRIIGNWREEALLGRAFVARAARYLIYAELCDRLASIIDPIGYDPWPRHRDHTGASLAVRAAVYDQVGGFPARSYREDLAFVARVRDAGFKLRHDPAVTVGVSARTKGRAPGGMADTLARWVSDAEAGRPHLVEAPDKVLARATRRRLLREAGTSQPDQIAVIASRLGLLPVELHDTEGNVLSPGALVQRYAADEPDVPPTVAVSDAIRTLKDMIASYERSVDAA